jgi:hypothetical protein
LRSESQSLRQRNTLWISFQSPFHLWSRDTGLGEMIQSAI